MFDGPQLVQLTDYLNSYKASIQSLMNDVAAIATNADLITADTTALATATQAATDAQAAIRSYIQTSAPAVANGTLAIDVYVAALDAQLIDCHTKDQAVGTAQVALANDQSVGAALNTTLVNDRASRDQIYNSFLAQAGQANLI